MLNSKNFVMKISFYCKVYGFCSTIGKADDPCVNGGNEGRKTTRKEGYEGLIFCDLCDFPYQTSSIEFISIRSQRSLGLQLLTFDNLLSSSI